MKVRKRDEEGRREINTKAYLKKKKDKKRECGKNRYHNISEEKRQKIKEY